MTSFEIRIAEPDLAGASSERRAEWEALAADLAEAVTSLDERRGRWTVGRTGDVFVVTTDDDRVPATRIEVSYADLAALIDEYLDVVLRLRDAGDGEGASRIDALDMAKKVTHDRAGRVLKRSLRPCETDHEVARRLFSLFVALAHDTSTIPGIHAALRAPEIV